MQFYKLPFVVFEDKRLLPNSQLLFCVLLNLCADKGFCWATNSYLAEKLAVKDRQLRNLLAELRECNYIECAADTEKAGSRQIYINANFLDSSAVHQPEKAAPKVAKSAKIKAEKSQKNDLEDSDFQRAKDAFCTFYNAINGLNYTFGAKEKAKLNDFLQVEKADDFCEFLQVFQFVAKNHPSELDLQPEKTNIFYICSTYNDLKMTCKNALKGIKKPKPYQKGGATITQDMIDGAADMLRKERERKQAEKELMQSMGIWRDSFEKS